jgi:SAM-dependent methyltransferase
MNLDTATLEPFTCQLCGSHIAGSRLEREGFTVRCCATCALGTTEPQSYVQSSHYDDLPTWSATVASKEGLFRKYQRDFLAHVHSCAPGGRLLDVGCSVGLLVDEANALGYVADGIDLDSHAVKSAQSQGRPVSLGRLEDCAPRSYDIICLSHTLEHIAEPEEFLRECARHLALGGMVAVAVPCHAGLLPRLFPRWWYGWMPAQHYCHYSPQAMRALFTKAGFHTVKSLQNTMDHRLQGEHLHRWQDVVKGVAVYLTALVGAACGMGDQLIAIGRTPASQEGAHAY